MLDALNILNRVFLSSTLLSSVTLYSDGDYVVQKTDEIRDVANVISTHREWWRSESKCKYIGVMVPYVRDWPETSVVSEVEVVHPPEPDKIAGQAFIFNRKICPDVPDEPILRLAEQWRNRGFIYEKRIITAEDLASMRPADRPKWIAQVLGRLRRVAEYDQKVKEFVDHLSMAVPAKQGQDQLSPEK